MDEATQNSQPLETTPLLREKILGIINLILGMFQVFWSLTIILLVLPKLKNTIENVNAKQPDFINSYLPLILLFSIGLSNFFIGTKLVIGKSGKRYFSYSLILAVTTFFLMIIFLSMSLKSIILPIYDLTGNLDKFPSPTSTTDPTASWKTYTDPTNTFTIKHPVRFYETRQWISQPLSGWKDSGVLSTVNPWNSSLGENDIVINFSVITKDKTEDMKDFVNRTINQNSGEFAPGDVSSSFKNYITVDGRKSLWYEGNLGPAVVHTEIYISKNDESAVMVEIYTDEPGKTGKPYTNEQKILLDQILSTFRFLPETTPAPSGLQACAQVITSAKNPQTGECREFPTPCDVPEGWIKVGRCG